MGPVGSIFGRFTVLDVAGSRWIDENSVLEVSWSRWIHKDNVLEVSQSRSIDKNSVFMVCGETVTLPGGMDNPRGGALQFLVFQWF